MVSLEDGKYVDSYDESQLEKAWQQMLKWHDIGVLRVRLDKMQARRDFHET